MDNKDKLLTLKLCNGKIPKGFKRVDKGIVRKGDIIKFIDFERAVALVGKRISLKMCGSTGCLTEVYRKDVLV